MSLRNTAVFRCMMTISCPYSRSSGELKCFRHSLDRPEYGPAYYGITLIPPESLGGFIEATLGCPQLSELTALLTEAQRENKFVIHFGI